MIEELIRAVLEAEDSPMLNVWADQADQETQIPYCVFTIIGGHEEMHLQGSANLNRRIVQVDTWARRRDMASNLMQWVRHKMLAAATFNVTGVEETGAPRYDGETKLYRSSYEFTLWYPQA
jgi:hypothetical protein